MKFKLSKNPYDQRSLFERGTLTLDEGGTYCLIGCNGSGKSTVLWQIENQLRHDGGYKILGRYGDFRDVFATEETKYNNYAFITFDLNTREADSEHEVIFSQLIQCQLSTGETIINRLGKQLNMLRRYITNPANQGKHLFVLFDDCDAGTSIDMINDIVGVFNLIRSDCTKNNITCTIIISANSFELARNFDCISVHNFSHRKFANYETFKKFVLHSRQIKEATYQNGTKQ